MLRNRKSDPPAPVAEGEMQVTMKGPPEKVREHMRIPSDGAPANGDGNDFVEAIRNPKNVVVVKRIAPRTWNGERSNFEVYREQCPLDLESIRDEVFSTQGGRKFRVAVVDAESGTTIAAMTIDNDADPIMPEPKSEDDANFFMRDAEQSPADMTEESLQKRATIVQHQINVETLQEQLDSLKERRNRGNGKPDAALDAKVAKLERDVIDANHRAEVKALEAKLDAVLKQQTAPVQDTGLKDMLQIMREDRKETDARFSKLLETMQTNQLTQIQQQLTSLQNAPKKEGTSMLESIQMFKEISGLLGVDLPGGDDDEDDEPKEWYEILVTKHLPKIWELMDQQKEKGEPGMTKEEMVKQIEAAADKATMEAMASVKARQQQTAPPLQQQPPPPAQTQAAPALNPTPPQVEPPKEERKIPSIDEEIVMRIAGVIGILEREMTLRPREWDWTAAAWTALPEDVLEKFVKADGPVAALAVFDGKVNQAGLDGLKAKLQADVKVEGYVRRGLEELRKWYDKSLLDPSYDPLADDGEEE